MEKEISQQLLDSNTYFGTIWTDDDYIYRQYNLITIKNDNRENSSGKTESTRQIR